MTKNEFFGKTEELLYKIGILCNNAKLRTSKANLVAESSYIGDPLEIALLVQAAKKHLSKPAIDMKHKKITQLSFSSSRKMMSVVCDIDNELYLLSKGAPEIILAKSAHFYEHKAGKVLEHALGVHERDYFLKINDDYAKTGLRVLGFSYKKITARELDIVVKDHDGAFDRVERGMNFVGFVGLLDPPRKDVKYALKRCEDAGISVKIITGDNIRTAEAVAKYLGIDGKAIEGFELRKNKNNKTKLTTLVDKNNIFARSNPEDKIILVEHLKKNRHVVAMTGDGINDAPALVKSDMGIAVGDGTDVAKEASSMVLLDNSFTNIVNAIEYGRIVFDNIIKFIVYLFSSNLAEVLVIALALILGWPLPLLAVQLLWINLITDGLPATFLGFERSDGVMSRKPYKDKAIFNKPRMAFLLVLALYVSIVSLLLFNLYNNISGFQYANTVLFTLVVFFELFSVYNFKSDIPLLFRNWFSLQKIKDFARIMFSNMYLNFAVLVSILIQFSALYTKTLNYLLRTVPLPIDVVIQLLVISASIVLIGDLFKLFSDIEI